MIETVVIIAITAISIAILALLYRAIKGPTVPDRVVALDAIGVNLIAIIALTSILLKTNAFLVIILLLSILSFIGTIAFSKYLEKGVIFDRDRDN